jgi:hypothetical protein
VSTTPAEVSATACRGGGVHGHFQSPANDALYESISIADHTARVGKTVLTWKLNGYRDYDSVHFDFDAPVLVRVLPTDKGSLTHWNDEWLDPYWEVEVIGEIPEEARGCSSYYLYGLSYNSETGACGGDMIDAPREIGGIA